GYQPHQGSGEGDAAAGPIFQVEQGCAGGDRKDTDRSSGRGELPEDEKRRDNEEHRGEGKHRGAEGEIGRCKGPVKEDGCDQVDTDGLCDSREKPGSQGGYPGESREGEEDDRTGEKREPGNR